MSQNIKVTSIDALAEFRAALCTFGEDAKAALGNVEMEARRTTDWLVRGQAMHWQAEIKRAELAVADAQAALFRRKITQQGAANDSEQKENLRVAKRRLAHAEEKLKTVKKWIPILQHAVAEYHARAHPLGDMIEGDLKTSLGLLDRMVAALDAYTKIAPPPGMAATVPGAAGARPSPAAAGAPESMAAGSAPEPAPAEPPPPAPDAEDGAPEPGGAPERGEPVAVEGT